MLLPFAAGCTHPKLGVEHWKQSPKTQRLQNSNSDKTKNYGVLKKNISPQIKIKASSEDRRTCGIRIDAALQDFIIARTRIRSLDKGKKQDSASEKNWNTTLQRIDAALTLAPIGEDLGAFVRAYAALSFEFEVDKEHKIGLPKNLGARIAQTLNSVNSRVEELRILKTPGMMAPRRRVEPGMLVLHRPVQNMLITSPFGLRTDPMHGRRRFHAGIDVGARFGTMVYAAAKGWVVYAGWQGGYGNHIVIDHGDGVRTHYSHLHQIYVQPGQVVQAQDTIGSIGATGRATGPHLHFAVTNGLGHFLDPSEALLHPMDTRLAFQASKKRVQRRATHREKQNKTKRRISKLETAESPAAIEELLDEADTP